MKNLYPGDENDFDKTAKMINIPMQMDNKDYGKKSKAVARKVQIRSSGTDDKFYGSRTIMTKENKQTFTEYLLTEEADLSAVPDSVFKEIKANIRKGAKDLTQHWRDALELLHRAYHVARVRRPGPTRKGAWKQYEELIKIAVQHLRANRGTEGQWRQSPVLIPEGHTADPLSKPRFFVEIPGTEPREVEATDLDEIIDTVTNKLRNKGTKIRIESRDKYTAVVTAWTNGEMRERIVIKEL